jgi:hypothetical protein
MFCSVEEINKHLNKFELVWWDNRQQSINRYYFKL